MSFLFFVFFFCTCAMPMDVSSVPNNLDIVEAVPWSESSSYHRKAAAVATTHLLMYKQGRR